MVLAEDLIERVNEQCINYSNFRKHKIVRDEAHRMFMAVLEHYKGDTLN